MLWPFFKRKLTTKDYLYRYCKIRILTFQFTINVLDKTDLNISIEIYTVIYDATHQIFQHQNTYFKHLIFHVYWLLQQTVLYCTGIGLLSFFIKLLHLISFQGSMSAQLSLHYHLSE